MLEKVSKEEVHLIANVAIVPIDKNRALAMVVQFLSGHLKIRKILMHIIQRYRKKLQIHNLLGKLWATTIAQNKVLLTLHQHLRLQEVMNRVLQIWNQGRAWNRNSLYYLRWDKQILTYVLAISIIKHLPWRFIARLILIV